ncbi:hypothetical protein G3O08_15095 [Cryomorpha ignava]|uniref:DUF4382 domain-containing protein n=1 Tax=Cryomorpha ignava TaxID=101383 RepID=A0A7K3WT11_9FLAO|nr:DUF6252 family protein [Cryomorpha ignava]NEN24827.1 hypothetical protein [Cryomorpha ignava]
MKLINKFLIGSLCLGLLTFTSCTKGDDDGPAEPEYQGTLTGDLTIIGNPEATVYTATSITATHDTSGFSAAPVKIEVVNSSGVKITIQLTDTTAQLAPYVLRRSGSNLSTIKLSANGETYTTRTDDIPGEDNGLITITDGGADDGILRGNIILLKWFKVKTTGPDSLVALMQNGSFEVPLVRKGFTFEPGDATVSAKINGAAFNPIATNKFGFTLISSSATGEMLSVELPDNTTVGEHALNESSDYAVDYTSGSTLYNSEGTINVTAFDANAGTATGTFQFTATPTSGGTAVSVTEGAFTF